MLRLLLGFNSWLRSLEDSLLISLPKENVKKIFPTPAEHKTKGVPSSFQEAFHELEAGMSEGAEVSSFLLLKVT